MLDGLRQGLARCTGLPDGQEGRATALFCSYKTVGRRMRNRPQMSAVDRDAPAVFHARDDARTPQNTGERLGSCGYGRGRERRASDSPFAAFRLLYHPPWTTTGLTTPRRCGPTRWAPRIPGQTPRTCVIPTPATPMRMPAGQPGPAAHHRQQGRRLNPLLAVPRGLADSLLRCQTRAGGWAGGCP